jgi:hypothetical protein
LEQITILVRQLTLPVLDTVRPLSMEHITLGIAQCTLTMRMIIFPVALCGRVKKDKKRRRKKRRQAKKNTLQQSSSSQARHTQTTKHLNTTTYHPTKPQQ